MQISNRVEENFIDAHLQWDSRINAENINVEADNGHIILRGFVSTYFERKLAYSIVWQLPGVRSVVNHITVKYPQSAPLPADQELKDNINHALMWHPAFDASDVDISVNAGQVDIKGSVKTYWHKISVEELIANIIGVTQITNQLAVVPTVNKADEATAEDIVGALNRTSEIDIDQVHVIVEEGHVTLEGKVPNARAYEQAYNAAIFTFGVIDVQNNLKIT